MRLTWTFFPKSQSSVTLTVVYLPKLDPLPIAGYLETESNTAFVGWDSFRIFNHGNQADKKSLFGSLRRIGKFDVATIQEDKGMTP